MARFWLARNTAQCDVIAEAPILTVWRRGSLVLNNTELLLPCEMCTGTSYLELPIVQATKTVVVVLVVVVVVVVLEMSII